MRYSEMGPSLYSYGTQYQSYVHAEARTVTYLPQHASEITICQQNFVQVSIESHFKTDQVVCSEDHVLAAEKKSRKPRLRWSSELHSRFVKAVDELGGAKKASPKAIQSIMGVDGVTLLHLKSHLQKYRHAKFEGRQQKEPKRPRASRKSGNMAKQPFHGAGSSASKSPPMASGFHKAEVSPQGHFAAETKTNDSSQVGAGGGQLQQTTMACDNLAAGMTIEVPQNETGFTPFPAIPPVYVQDLSTDEDNTYGFLHTPDSSVEEYLEHDGQSTSSALENLPGFGGEASAAFGTWDFGQTYLDWERNQLSTMDCVLEETYPFSTMFANLP